MQKSSKGRSVVGHPVDVASGTLFNIWEDIYVPGRMELVWQRKYSTSFLDRPATALGMGWTFGFLATLCESADGYHFWGPQGDEIVLEDPAGTVRAGKVVRNFGMFTELEQDQDQYIVTQWDPDSHDATRFIFREGDLGKPWPLRSIEDVMGQGIDLQYDSQGRLVKVRQRREGRSLTLRYNYQGFISSVSFIRSDGREQPLMSYEYDERGRLIVAYNPLGYADRYEYDSHHHMIREVSRNGGVFHFHYDAQGRCVSTSGLDGYDSRTLRYSDSIRWTEVTDSLGEVWRYRWRATGQVERVISPLGAESVTAYDEYDRIVEEVDANGGATKYRFDGAGNRCEITDPLGQVVRFEYNARRQLTKFVDTAGHEWKLAYNERGHLVSAEDPLGSRWQCWTNEHGEVVQAEDAIGGRTSIRYDDRGDLTEQSDWEGNVTRYECDDFGRIVRKVDPLGYETRYAYDEAGQLILVTLPDGSQRRFGYDPAGNLSIIIDANEQETKFRYGTCGRLMESIDPLGQPTKYRWTTEPSRLAEVVNGKGQSYRFEYDADGWLIAEIDFEGRTWTYAHDQCGNCTRITNGAGEETLLEYNPLHRLIRKQLPDGGEVTFEYDALGNIIHAKNATCAVVFERDATGRVIKERQGEYEVASAYDLIGNRIERRTTLGHRARFVYDHNCFLRAVHLGDHSVVRMERDALGQETLRRFPWGVVRQEYDSIGRLIKQWTEKSRIGVPDSRGYTSVGRTTPTFRSGETDLVRRIYKYDPGNNLVGMEDLRWGTTRYSYDKAGQLIQAIHDLASEEIFQYDPAGNIRRSVLDRGSSSKSGQISSMIREEDWGYGPGNRLACKDTTRYEYDADGRVIRKIEEADLANPRVWEYQWNGEGWLAAIKRPDGAVWHYYYDAFGRRVRKDGPKGSARFVWDGDLVVHIISASRSVSTWLFEPDGFAPIATEQAGRLYFSVNDQIGTPRELIGSDGEVAWSSYLSAWGRVEAFAAQQMDCPVRFQGQWWDEESGLTYNRFRYYDSSTGRFCSPDPIGIMGDINPYQYAPSPTAWIDPFGLDRVTENVGGRQYHFDRDNQGRTVRAEGPLCNPNRLTYEYRDTSAQRTVAQGTGNHAGHLIGNQFGGPGGQNNLVQMCPKLNLSGWKRMENQLTALTRNNKVNVVVNVHYKGNSTVPSKFTVTAQVTDRNGKTTTRRWTHKNCT